MRLSELSVILKKRFNLFQLRRGLFLPDKKSRLSFVNLPASVDGQVE